MSRTQIKAYKKDQLRPISLLPSVSKICEKAVLNVYSEHLLCHFDDYQYAYRPNSSTTCALIAIHENVLNFLDDIHVGAVRIITFDMSRAFDRVPHDMLLSYLCSLELPYCEFFVNWVNSYLSNRHQRVKIGNTISSTSIVSSGVPQGSLLGPLLFSIYFSSYKPADRQCRIVKYADDITLIVPVYKTTFNDMSLINAEISFFEKWCDCHKMSINTSKTKVLNINFSNHPLTFVPMFDNVTVIKILGLHFNTKLSWLDHYNFVVKKTSSRLYVLRILKSLLNHDEMVIVFYALIQSVLDYASPLFLNNHAYLDVKFVSLCKRAFRIIHGFGVKACNDCDILNVYERRKFLSIKLFEKALYSRSHVLHYFLPNLSPRSNRLILPSARTKRKIDGFVFSCSRFHNENL